MRHLKLWALGAVTFLAIGQSLAQQTEIYTHPDQAYDRARMLFDKEQYVQAQDQFAQLIKTHPEAHSEIRIDAEYYHAICALELQQRNAEQAVEEFVRAHPASPRVDEITWHTAGHYFSRRKYSDAMQWYEKMNPRVLPRADRSEYHFKLGYSYFMREKYDEAKTQLVEVVDANSEYQSSARYYYGHIAYTEGKTASALEYFESLRKDPSFGPIVPYYITQIYYEQERWEDLASSGQSLLASATEKRAPEVARLIGEAHYNMEEYEEALPYFERYREEGPRMKDEDYYQLGYTYYRSERYDDALGAFNKIVDSRDSLAQNAYFHLADCYLKKELKSEALNAFESVAQLDYNHELTETARFNVAKLSYEVGNPYQDPGRELQAFIDDYPESEYFEEASTYLVNAYLTTKDYGRALESLERLGPRTRQLEGAYQKIAYNRAIEFFNNRMWQNSLDLFGKSLRYPVDRDLEAEAYYWMAEALYRQKRYDEARVAYGDFQVTPGATQHPLFNRSRYGLGYVYFQKGDYSNAAAHFRKFLDEAEGEKDRLIHDALLRTGDSYFVTKGYYTANRFYEDAAKMRGPDQDYAYFQAALCQGLLGKNQARIDQLNALVRDQPTSEYVDDAYYTLGKGYMQAGQNEQAIQAFQRVLDDFPDSYYARKSLMNQGLIHYNEGANERALIVLRDVVDKHPNSPEANEAVAIAEKIYIDLGNVEAYANWVKGLDFTNITDAELDSLTFDAAYLKYTAGDCNQTLPALNQYLDKYPSGIFHLDVHYYRAQCRFQIDDLSGALEDYEFLALASPNKYNEEALLQSSYLYYSRENWEMALERYAFLERQAAFPENRRTAVIGLMRTNFKLEKSEKAVDYANRVLRIEKLDVDLEQEAHIILAKSALKSGDRVVAQREFLWVEDKAANVFRAEAKYYLAELEFDAGHYEESQKRIFDLLQNMPSYQYWGNKALILLARNYWKLEDLYQANFTLDQILQRSNNEEILAEARRWKEAIARSEERKVEEKQRIEIDTLQIEMPEEMDEQENEE